MKLKLVGPFYLMKLSQVLANWLKTTYETVSLEFAFRYISLTMLPSSYILAIAGGKQLFKMIS